MGGGFFKGMLGFHIQLTGHLVSVISGQVVIQRLTVATDAAAYRGGMGCENGAHERHFPFRVKQSHTCGPFVKMGKDILMAHPLV